MDLQELLSRPSLAGQPLSLILVLAEGESNELAGALARAADLLAGRNPLDEILVVLAWTSPTRPPNWTHGLRVRTLRHLAPAGGPALAMAFQGARRPILLRVDRDSSLARAELIQILDRLNRADAVIGRRAGRSVGTRLSTFLLRRIFAIPVADPRSPIAAFRRDAVAGVPLETSGKWLGIELLAKLTYLEALIDESPIHLSARSEREDAGAGFWRMLIQPTFWNADGSDRLVRPDPRTLPAARTAPPPGATWRPLRLAIHSSSPWSRRRHPLQSPRLRDRLMH